MEITVYVVNNITDEHIHRFFTEDVLVPDVNDTIGFSSIGDFVVARREFGYVYDDEYGCDVLDYILLRVYPKPTGIFLGDTMTKLDIEKRRDGI